MLKNASRSFLLKKKCDNLKSKLIGGILVSGSCPASWETVELNYRKLPQWKVITDASHVGNSPEGLQDRTAA